MQVVIGLHEELQYSKQLECFGVGAEEEQQNVLEAGFLLLSF